MVVSVNGTGVSKLKHKQAQDLILRGGNSVSLAVNRYFYILLCVVGLINVECVSKEISLAWLSGLASLGECSAPGEEECKLSVVQAGQI